MKKIIKNYSKDIKCPHLFLEDIEEIEGILKSLNPRKFEIKTPEYEFECISEIPSIITSTNDLRIYTFSPYLNVELHKSWAQIDCDGDNDNALGAMLRIENIISKRERKYYWLFSKPLLYVLTCIIIAVSILQIVSWAQGSYLEWTAYIIWPMLIIQFMSIHCTTKKYSKVEFVKRAERQSFFIRKKDDILLLIIGALIGGALGSFMTLLMSKLLK